LGGASTWLHKKVGRSGTGVGVPAGNESESEQEARCGGSETTILDLINALLIHGMIVQGTASGPHYGPISVGAPDEKACRECEKLGARVGELVRRLA
jgi:multimeric flavodoxin WrbA